MKQLTQLDAARAILSGRLQGKTLNGITFGAHQKQMAHSVVYRLYNGGPYQIGRVHYYYRRPVFNLDHAFIYVCMDGFYANKVLVVNNDWFGGLDELTSKVSSNNQR